MEKAKSITSLFVDIGGVLLTNGRDHRRRRRAATLASIGLRTVTEVGDEEH